jgi:hypothetical protein
MTALIYILQENQVYVAMDTLCLRSDNGKPLAFTSKIFPLPHLNGLMCGTGILDFIVNWSAHVKTSIIAKDVDQLSIYSPSSLRKLWDKFHFDEEQTSTIYYFGYSSKDERYKGFAFRSTSNFDLEELSYSIGIKPPLKNVNDNTEIKELPLDVIRIISEQKKQDDLLPFKQRLGIGGEIQLAILQPDTIIIKTIHRFDDYQNYYDQMCEGLSEV